MPSLRPFSPCPSFQGIRAASRYHYHRPRRSLPENLNQLTLAHVLLRLGAAVGVGAVIGLDRELRRKPAGIRTLALVALGSALFVLETIDPLRGAYTDASSRIIQGVVTGVGFLGAGSIMRGTDDSVRGLTTAAAIWLAAALGIACGLANWPLVAGGAILGLLVLMITPVERVIHNRRRSDPKETAVTTAP
jgi:putative Mg2+ transporter-C (MgtC) family protein